MPSKDMFREDPRTYATELVAEGHTAEHLLECALRFMSHDDVRKMLDNEELSPRFDEDEPEYICPDCGGEITQSPTFPERYYCDDAEENDCDAWYVRDELEES